MVYAAALGAAALYAVASVLQQRSAAAEPPRRGLRIGLLVDLAARPLWIAGNVADVGGYVLQFVALGHGALMLVQPLLVSGLLFALPLGARLSHARLRRVDWVAAIAVVAGLAAFLVAAVPGRALHRPSGLRWAVLIAVVLVPVITVAGVARSRPPALRASLLAACSGVLYALTAALTEATAHILGRGVSHLLTAWQPYALLGCGALGMVAVQTAFQAGPLTWSLPLLTAVDPVVSILIGVFVFGERLHSTTTSVAVEVAGVAAMVVGVLVLARSPVVCATDEPPHKATT